MSLSLVPGQSYRSEEGAGVIAVCVYFIIIFSSHGSSSSSGQSASSDSSMDSLDPLVMVWVRVLISK